MWKFYTHRRWKTSSKMNSESQIKVNVPTIDTFKYFFVTVSQISPKLIN